MSLMTRHLPETKGGNQVILRASAPSIVTYVVAYLMFGGVWQPSHAGQIYDAAADFSPTNNPIGVWTYGFSSTLGGTLTDYTNAATLSGVHIWRGASDDPSVFWNGTSQPVTLYTWTLQPHQLAFHPGAGGEYSVIRFTTPSAGMFTLASAFLGIDYVGTTTQVYVLENGTSLFAGSISGYGASASYSTTLSLLAGDNIEFAVGYSNGSHLFDTTAVSATLTAISPVPEIDPSGLGSALAAVTGGLALIERRRLKVA